jgi:hypothetical protein
MLVIPVGESPKQRQVGGVAMKVCPEYFGQMEAFTLTAADTGERLRTKHIRTLEAMQKLISDNYALQERLAATSRRKTVDDSDTEQLQAQNEAQRLAFEREVGCDRMILKITC